MPPRKAVILFAHGSRDPLWRKPVEAVAARLAAQGVAVGCAYLELDQPDLAACAAGLVAAGAGQISIVPMFLGTGKHAREDLPVLVERLRSTHPAIGFTLKNAVGEDARVLDLLAAIALE
jgi:sirohydrochlorin cobaltochelatase